MGLSHIVVNIKVSQILLLIDYVGSMRVFLISANYLAEQVLEFLFIVFANLMPVQILLSKLKNTVFVMVKKLT